MSFRLEVESAKRDPALELIWQDGDWSVYMRTIVFSKNYYVAYKGEIVQFANNLIAAVEWINNQEEWGGDDPNQYALPFAR